MNKEVVGVMPTFVQRYMWYVNQKNEYCVENIKKRANAEYNNVVQIGLEYGNDGVNEYVFYPTKTIFFPVVVL